MAKKRQSKSKSKKGTRSRGLYGDGGKIKGNGGRGLYKKRSRKKK